MATVFIPRRLRQLADGETSVQAAGDTVRQLIEDVRRRHPELAARLIAADGARLARGTAVTVDGVSSELGLLEPVRPDSEVHFLPAIAGGAPT